MCVSTEQVNGLPSTLPAKPEQAKQFEEDDFSIVGCWDYYAGLFGLCCVGRKDKDTIPEDTRTVVSNDSGTAPMIENRESCDDSTVVTKNQRFSTRRSGKHWKTRLPKPDPPLDTSDELPKKPKGIRAVIAALSCLKKSGNGQNLEEMGNSSKPENQKWKGLFGMRNKNAMKGSGKDDVNAKIAESVEKRGDENDGKTEETADESRWTHDGQKEQPEGTTVVTFEAYDVRSDLTDDRSVMGSYDHTTSTLPLQ